MSHIHSALIHFCLSYLMYSTTRFFIRGRRVQDDTVQLRASVTQVLYMQQNLNGVRFNMKSLGGIFSQQVGYFWPFCVQVVRKQDQILKINTLQLYEKSINLTVVLSRIRVNLLDFEKGRRREFGSQEKIYIKNKHPQPQKTKAVRIWFTRKIYKKVHISDLEERRR